MILLRAQNRCSRTRDGSLLKKNVNSRLMLVGHSSERVPMSWQDGTVGPAPVSAGPCAQSWSALVVGTVQLRAEKFHPHFPISIAHPDPAFAQPLDNDQRRGKSHPRCELPSPDVPSTRSSSPNSRTSVFSIEDLEIANRPAHRSPSNIVTNSWSLTRASSDRHSQDGYLSGLSAQARRYRCQAGVSSSPSSFPVGRVGFF